MALTLFLLGLALARQDLDRYPRQFERDLELLSAEGLADLMFKPTPEEMYTPDHR